MIVTEEAGRDRAAVSSLVALAEALGAPVVEGWQPYYANFPRDHPLYGGIVAEDMPDALAQADVMFLVEAVAPWHPPSAAPPAPACSYSARIRCVHGCRSGVFAPTWSPPARSGPRSSGWWIACGRSCRRARGRRSSRNGASGTRASGPPGARRLAPRGAGQRSKTAGSRTS